jgi:hypothetical protein
MYIERTSRSRRKLEKEVLKYCSFRDNRTALVSNRSGDESETGGAATGDAVIGGEEKSNEQSNAESSIGQSTSSQAASSQDAIQNAVALAVEAAKAAAIEVVRKSAHDAGIKCLSF